ncbi:hypothetical protein [Sphingomonas koreensis]|uniref:hypothetical protein n=1 Tax=Sphingomonas koreensis TaxID=93064 RepID=UPI0013DD90EB|nr:hypothetical protein [Sphingomonas koreensis]MDC7812062.1 hypothetical protein [Sphingomonas koreensis]
MTIQRRQHHADGAFCLSVFEGKYHPNRVEILGMLNAPEPVQPLLIRMHVIG